MRDPSPAGGPARSGPDETPAPARRREEPTLGLAMLHRPARNEPSRPGRSQARGWEEAREALALQFSFGNAAVSRALDTGEIDLDEEHEEEQIPDRMPLETAEESADADAEPEASDEAEEEEEQERPVDEEERSAEEVDSETGQAKPAATAEQQEEEGGEIEEAETEGEAEAETEGAAESEAVLQDAEAGAAATAEGGAGETAAAAEGPAAPTIQEWRSGIRARTAYIPAPQLGEAANAPARLRQATGAAAAVQRSTRSNASQNAQQAVTPAPQVDTPLPPPEPNPVPEATARVDAASDRKLPDQTLPGLQKSPRGTQPSMTAMVAQERGTAVVVGTPPVADEAGAAETNPDQERVTQIQDANAAALEPRQAQGEPVTLVDQGAPPPPPVPEASKSDVAGSIAVILADIPGEAAKMVQNVQRDAFPRGMLLEAFPNIGDEVIPEVEQELRDQLNEVARLAGVSAEELDAKVRDRQQELAERAQQSCLEVQAATSEGTETLATETQSTLDANAGAREAVDQHTELQTEAASGKADPAVIRSRQERLSRTIARKVGQQVVAYSQAGDRRQKALDDTGQAMQNAYIITARREEQEIRARLEAEGRPLEEARAESEPGYQWARDRINETRQTVATFKAATGKTSTTNQSDVKSAGTDAYDLIREWADAQVSEHSSWWDRLMDLFRNWSAQAYAEAEAWEAANNQAARDGLVRDLALVGTLQQLEARNIDGSALAGQAGITDEQRAVIAAYYAEGPDGGNPLVAVAAGLRARIEAGRRPGLTERFKQMVLDAPDAEWENVGLIGAAERPGFNAYTIASQCDEAMDGVGTTESLIFSALASLTPIQAAAVRKCYRAEGFGSDLDKDLDDELSGEELRRAEALLAGDQTLADVATLREAIEGAGTDEATIMRVLRGKSQEERARILEVYNQTYGDDLNKDLEGDLSDHDLDRANALLEGNTAKADAIALDQAMHGGLFGLGTDEGQITQVYADTRQDVENEGAQRGWTTAQIEAEIVRRNQGIEGEYETRYGTGEAGDKSALRQAFDAELSGPDLDLALALADNNMVEADAARLEIERRGFYTDDDAVNGILRSQYERARKEVKRDLQIDLEQRGQIAGLRGEDFNWKAEREAMDRRVDEDSRTRAGSYMTSLEQTYDTKYSRWGSGGLQVLIAMNMSGTDREEAQALLKGRGYLTPEQELYYAVEGVGTDEDRVKRVLAGKTPQQIQAIREAWNREHPDEPFDERIRGEFSGREEFDIQLALEGEPQTPQERVARARKKLEYEQNAYLLGGAFASEEGARLQRRFDALERDEQRLASMPEGSDEYARALERFDIQEANVNRAVEDNRRAVDKVTDIAATIAGVVATVVVIVVAVLATIATGGAAAPGIGAAIAAVMSSASVAATAAGAAAIATVATKYAFKGGAYGVEDMGVDLAVGAVDVVASYLTAGLGAKLIAGKLANLGASKSIVPRLIGNAMAEGAEGFAQALPSALTGAALNDKNWDSPDTLGSIFGQTMTGVGIATVLSGGMGSLGGIAKPTKKLGAEAVDVLGAQAQRKAGAETADILARRGTPAQRLAGWRAFSEANPGKTYDDFLSDLDAGILGRQASEDAVRQLQRQMRGDLLASIPPAQRGQFKDVPIEVLSDADFQRLTRSSRAQAVVLIENGKPRVLLREGVDPRVLRQEGPHLLQSVDPRTARKVAALDEARLANWDQLPIDEQFRLYRNKIDLEIDGQYRLIKSLSDDLDRAGIDDAARRSIREQLETAQENLNQLSKRLDDVDSITPAQRVGMSRGQPPPPQYLDQPPRLFSKKVIPRADPDAPRFSLHDAPSPWAKRLEPGERIHRVGDVWHEPPLPDPTARLYRQVEVLDAQGRIKKLRQEIEMPDGTWRQRGSESAARGSLVEEASLLLTQQRAARATKTKIKTLGTKSQRPGGQGFDEVFFEFKGGKATVVVAEVKDYPGRYVPAEDFTAITTNLTDNIDRLKKQIDRELGLPPSQRTLGLDDVELGQISDALDAKRFRVELRLGPTTKLGTFTSGGQGGVIRTIKSFWGQAKFGRVPVKTTRIGAELVEEAATLPSNVKAHGLLGTRPRFHALADSAAGKKILTPPFEQGPADLLIDNQSRLVALRSPTPGSVTKDNADHLAAQLVATLTTALPHPRPPHMQAPVTMVLDVSRLGPEARKVLADAIDDVVAKKHIERSVLGRLHVVDDVP